MPDRYGDNFLFCDLTDRDLLDQPISEDEKEIIDEIIHTVANLTDTDEIAEYLYYKTIDLIPCDLLAIGFIEEQGKPYPHHQRNIQLPSIQYHGGRHDRQQEHGS